MTSPSPNSCAATVIDRDTTGRIDGSAAQEPPGADAAGAAGAGDGVPAVLAAEAVPGSAFGGATGGVGLVGVAGADAGVLALAPVLARRCLRRIATAHRPAEARVTRSAICPT